MLQRISRRHLLTGLAGTEKQNDVASGSEPRRAYIGGGCVEVQGISCRRCVEVCDPRAIRQPPIRQRREAPAVQVELCTGCGDCAPVCPTGVIALLPATSASAALDPAPGPAS